MSYSRRSLIAAAASLSALGLAGCSSQESTSGTQDGGDGSSSDGSTTTTANATNATSTGTPTATPYASPFVRDTTLVFGEVSWFANEYNTTIYQYRSHVRDIESMVAAARDQPELAASDVDEMRSRASTFYEYVREEMAPHFNQTADIIGTTDHYLGQVERFRRRDDAAGVDSQLSSFKRYYHGLALDSFIAEHFSGRPIRRPLYTYLTASNLGSAKPVFVVGHPGQTFVRPCRLSSSWNIDLLADSPMDSEKTRVYLRRLEFLFDGVGVDTGRTERIFVESHTVNGPRRLRPIYVQRFADVTSAEAALSTVLDRTTGEGTTGDYGRPTWHRVFYRKNIRMEFLEEGPAIYDVDEDTVYGPSGLVVPETAQRHIFDRPRIQREDEPGRNVYVYLTRAGRHLVAASPSTLAWEERPPGAENAIKNTWLWG